MPRLLRTAQRQRRLFRDRTLEVARHRGGGEAEEQEDFSQRVAAVVVRGDAEIGFQQISEILEAPGAELVAPLPDEVQRITVFSAGVLTKARNPDGAAGLIRFLASEDAAETIASTELIL